MKSKAESRGHVVLASSGLWTWWWLVLGFRRTHNSMSMFGVGWTNQPLVSRWTNLFDKLKAKALSMSPSFLACATPTIPLSFGKWNSRHNWRFLMAGFASTSSHLSARNRMNSDSWVLENPWPLGANRAKPFSCWLQNVSLVLLLL